MTDTPTPVIPHRSWCVDPADLYVFTDQGIRLARCRSCRAEVLERPGPDEPSTA